MKNTETTKKGFLTLARKKKRREGISVVPSEEQLQNTLAQDTRLKLLFILYDSTKYLTTQELRNLLELRFEKGRSLQCLTKHLDLLRDYGFVEHSYYHKNTKRNAGLFNKWRLSQPARDVLVARYGGNL